MATNRIPGLSALHRANVKLVQPYHAGNEASRHPLSILADLSNADKHRVVNPSYGFGDWDAGETLDRLCAGTQDGPAHVEHWWLAKGGQRLKDGAPWFRIGFARGEEPPRKVEVGGNLPIGIAFGEMGLAAAEFPRIAQLVEAITKQFLADFPETQFVG